MVFLKGYEMLKIRFKTMWISILLLTAINLFAKQSFDLRVEVNHLRNSKGVVQFAIYNKDGSMPDEHFKKFYKKSVAKITNRSAFTVFKDLPKGRYAVNILHDENENGKIDKGFLLPKEGIGFSNYQSIGITHKPNFKDASFVLDQNMSKTIKVIYF